MCNQVTNVVSEYCTTRWNNLSLSLELMPLWGSRRLEYNLFSYLFCTNYNKRLIISYIITFRLTSLKLILKVGRNSVWYLAVRSLNIFTDDNSSFCVLNRSHHWQFSFFPVLSWNNHWQLNEVLQNNTVARQRRLLGTGSSITSVTKWRPAMHFI